MRMRFMVAAFMAALLIAGMVSSAACEIACAPASTSTISTCCPQQMRHSEKTFFVSSTHTCGHPQENLATVITDAYGIQTHATPDIVPASVAEISSYSWIPAYDTPPLIALTRSSFTIPLRI